MTGLGLRVDFGASAEICGAIVRFKVLLAVSLAAGKPLSGCPALCIVSDLDPVIIPCTEALATLTDNGAI